MLARVENGTVMELVNVDLSAVPAHKRTNWLPVEGEQPEFDPICERLSGPSYTVEATRVVRSWVINRFVPGVVTNYQARAAMIAAGIFDQVNTAMMALPASSIERQAWEYANVFRRQSPIIEALGAQLNLSSAQIDDLFVAAAKVD